MRLSAKSITQHINNKFNQNGLLNVSTSKSEQFFTVKIKNHLGEKIGFFEERIEYAESNPANFLKNMDTHIKWQLGY